MKKDSNATTGYILVLCAGILWGSIGFFVRKLNGLGVETHDMFDAYFSLDVLRNEGSAVVNSVSARRVKNLIPAYTDDDISKLSDFLLGKETDIKAGTDYDVNGDGKWDIYDLGLMRKVIAEGKAKGYVEPDENTGFGYPMHAYDELKRQCFKTVDNVLEAVEDVLRINKESPQR